MHTCIEIQVVAHFSTSGNASNSSRQCMWSSFSLDKRPPVCFFFLNDALYPVRKPSDSVVISGFDSIGLLLFLSYKLIALLQSCGKVPLNVLLNSGVGEITRETAFIFPNSHDTSLAKGGACNLEGCLVFSELYLREQKLELYFLREGRHHISWVGSLTVFYRCTINLRAFSKQITCRAWVLSLACFSVLTSLSYM